MLRARWGIPEPARYDQERRPASENILRSGTERGIFA